MSEENKEVKSDDVNVGGLDAPAEDGGSDIMLKSKDNDSLAVPRKWALLSGLVKTALESDASASEAPVDVASKTLAKVIEYLNYHKGVDPGVPEKPLRSKIMKEVCSHAWDAEFIDAIGEDRDNLYNLILAANYMDIKPLLYLGCAKVASLIKGVPIDKIKGILDPNGVYSAAKKSAEATPAPEEKKE